jgi:hypothetical protein
MSGHNSDGCGNVLLYVMARLALKAALMSGGTYSSG